MEYHKTSDEILDELFRSIEKQKEISLNKIKTKESSIINAKLKKTPKIIGKSSEPSTSSKKSACGDHSHRTKNSSDHCKNSSRHIKCDKYTSSREDHHYSSKSCSFKLTTTSYKLKIHTNDTRGGKKDKYFRHRSSREKYHSEKTKHHSSRSRSNHKDIRQSRKEKNNTDASRACSSSKDDKRYTQPCRDSVSVSKEYPADDRSEISKTIAKYTEFCKRLSSIGDGVDSDNEEESKPFINHPFVVKDRPMNVVINLKDAVQLPIKTPAERAVDAAKVRIQFPVSSGEQHRTGEMEWVPVTEDAVSAQLVDHKDPKLDNLVLMKIKALRRLSSNPRDADAITDVFLAQNQSNQTNVVSDSSTQLGLFTGNTGIKALSPNELHKGNPAWAHKDQFKEATPVKGGVGMSLLRKMGWNPGEGLGKNKEGSTEPLILDIKTDKKGLISSDECHKKTLCGGKHPVSMLMELCTKKKWNSPMFELIGEDGPPHKRCFLMKVTVNRLTFQANIMSDTKKQAKFNAAIMALDYFSKVENLMIT